MAAPVSMKRPLSKTQSSPFLGAPGTEPDGGARYLKSSAGGCDASGSGDAVIPWASADYLGRSLPLLPRPAARLSLCMDFPCYLQALQQDHAAGPPGLRIKARTLRLSAVDPTSNPQSDPRGGSPTYMTLLPPGLSQGSLAGATKEEDQVSGGGRPAGRQNIRASVDAAAGAVLLATLELSQCPASPPKPDLIPSPHHLGPAPAAAPQQARQPLLFAAPTSPPPSPPPLPPPPDAATSQSQVPLQVEWSFGSDLQRARTQARYAAMDALDEIRYEAVSDGDSDIDIIGGGAGGDDLTGVSSGRRSASGRPTAGGIAGDANKAGGGSFQERHAARRKGVTTCWGVFSARKRRTLRAVGPGAAGAVEVEGPGSAGRTAGSIDAADAGMEAEDVDADAAEGLLLGVQRSRDSRLVHRVRLAMDVTRRPADGAAAGPSSDDTPSAGEGVDTALEAAAAAFAAATAAEQRQRGSLSGPTFSEVAAVGAAAPQRRVYFRVPLVDRVHWFTRSRDYRSASCDYEEEGSGGGRGRGGGGGSSGSGLFSWAARRSQQPQPAGRLGSQAAAVVGSAQPGSGGRVGRLQGQDSRSESFSQALRRRSRMFLALAASVLTRGSAAQAKQPRGSSARPVARSNSSGSRSNGAARERGGWR